MNFEDRQLSDDDARRTRSVPPLADRPRLLAEDRRRSSAMIKDLAAFAAIVLLIAAVVLLLP